MSREAIIEQKALALRDHILSQPEILYTNNPWALVDAIESFAQATAMMTFRKPKLTLARQHLAQMTLPPRTLLEFGTYVGASAIAWGAMLREFTPDAAASCRVYTFELSAVTAGVARDLIRLAGLDDIVTVVEGPAAASVQKLYAEGAVRAGGVDVVFFDHWEKFYVPDLRVCEDLGLLRVGALAIADNTDRPGAPAYLEYVRAGGRPEGQVRWETRSLEADVEEGLPKIVEVSTVVEVKA